LPVTHSTRLLTDSAYEVVKRRMKLEESVLNLVMSVLGPQRLFSHFWFKHAHLHVL